MERRGWEVVDAIVTPAEAMGRVDSELFRSRAPFDRDLPPPRLVFRHLSTPPVISSCRYLKHGSHPDNAGIPFSTTTTTTTTTTTVDATLHRCRCHCVASNSIRRRDRALACGGKVRKKHERGGVVCELIDGA